MPNQQKPLEGRDARIAAAQSWARSFSYECESALEGKLNQMPRAAAQLIRAIEQIDGNEEVDPEEICKCGCTRFNHHGEKGDGRCVESDCLCHSFDPVTK